MRVLKRSSYVVAVLLSIAITMGYLSSLAFTSYVSYVSSTAVFWAKVPFGNDDRINIQWSVPSKINISNRVPISFKIQITGGNNPGYYIYINTYIVYNNKKVAIDSFSLWLGTGTRDIVRYVVVPQNLVSSNGIVEFTLDCSNGNTYRCGVTSVVPITVPVVNFAGMPSSINVEMPSGSVIVGVGNSTSFIVKIKFDAQTTIEHIDIDVQPYIVVATQTSLPVNVAPNETVALKFLVFGVSPGAGVIRMKIWYKYGIVERFVSVYVPIICQYSNVTDAIEKYIGLIKEYKKLLTELASYFGYIGDVNESVTILNKILQKINSITDLEKINKQISTIENQLASLEKKIKSQDNNINYLLKQLTTLQSMENNIAKQLSSLANSEKALSERIKTDESKISDINALVNSLSNEINTLKHDISNLQNNMVSQYSYLNTKLEECNNGLKKWSKKYNN